jgi:hypothetical protein
LDAFSFVLDFVLGIPFHTSQTAKARWVTKNKVVNTALGRGKASFLQPVWRLWKDDEYRSHRQLQRGAVASGFCFPAAAALVEPRFHI